MEEITGSSQKRLVGELEKGREFATQLQTLLKNKPRGDCESIVSAKGLALKILNSFNNVLAELRSDGSTEMSQILGTGFFRPNFSGDWMSQESGDGKRKAKMKDRRGCYKRRQDSGSTVIVSSTTADGYAWRKYGQKHILDSKYPRCYFRCTHKYDQCCRATKQVQRIKEEPIMYQITYFGSHTCGKTIGYFSQISPDSSAFSSCIPSFESKIPIANRQLEEISSGLSTTAAVKAEKSSNNNKEEEMTQNDNVSDEKSAVVDDYDESCALWQEISSFCKFSSSSNVAYLPSGLEDMDHMAETFKFTNLDYDFFGHFDCL